MAPASLPEGVETAVKAMTGAKTNLELAIRRVRKKLETVPGALGEKVEEGRVYLIKDKCGTCPPCLVKNTCGECSSCQDRPRANTRGHSQDQDLPACLEKARYCTTWPPELAPPPDLPSVETASSVVSEKTPKSLKASMKAVKDELRKLANASADLSFAVKAAGGGPWEGWPELAEEETT